MDNEIVTHLLDIKKELGAQSATLGRLDQSVHGNGQPGLVQKVEQLEKAKNWTWGVGAAITFLVGLFESLLHLGHQK